MNLPQMPEWLKQSARRVDHKGHDQWQRRVEAAFDDYQANKPFDDYQKEFNEYLPDDLTVRVRLPNDYIVTNRDVADKPLTLDDYNRRVLQPMMVRVAREETEWYKQWRETLKFWDYEPTTRWRRVLNRFVLNPWGRATDAWDVLLGRKDAT